jgi:hypothetical protein
MVDQLDLEDEETEKPEFKLEEPDAEDEKPAAEKA